MIGNLRPYSANKNSGVPWLGEVPKHWEVQRIKTLFREKDERSGDGRGVLLSLTRARGIVPHAEASNRIASAEDLSKYKVCRPGDLVMNRMQAWSGMFAVSSREGLISPDYSVFGAIGVCNVKYFEHLFKTPVLVEQFAQRSQGIGSGFNRLYTPDFGSIPIAFPLLPEQTAIVRFLDYIGSRIRRYIRAKQKLIKLLEEQKQAIIHQAVTRGLNSNVRLKPSGVEWLGVVPEHWIIKPLKHWAKLNRQTLGEMTDPDFQFRYIDIGTIETGRLVREPTRLRFGSAPSRARRILRKGDTIVSTVRTYLKAIWYVNQEADDLIASTGFAVLSPNNGVEPSYLGYVIQDNNFVDRVMEHSIGIAYPAIAETVLGRFPVALPPTREEQHKLTEWIETESRPVTQAIDRAYRGIFLLREYRTRMIADVVTGKFDVREVAARLPNDGEEVKPSDEPEEIEKDDDIETEGDPATAPEEAGE